MSRRRLYMDGQGCSGLSLSARGAVLRTAANRTPARRQPATRINRTRYDTDGSSSTRSGIRYGLAGRSDGGGDSRDDDDEVDNDVGSDADSSDSDDNNKRLEHLYGMDGDHGDDDGDMDPYPRNRPGFVKRCATMISFYCCLLVTRTRGLAKTAIQRMMNRNLKLATWTILVDTFIISYFRRRRLLLRLFWAILLPFAITGLIYFYNNSNSMVNLFGSTYSSSMWPSSSSMDGSWWTTLSSLGSGCFGWFFTNSPTSAVPPIQLGKGDCCMSDEQLYDKIKYMVPSIQGALHQGSAVLEERLHKEQKDALLQLKRELQQYIQDNTAKGTEQAGSMASGLVVQLEKTQRDHATKIADMQEGFSDINRHIKELTDRLNSALEQLRLQSGDHQSGMVMLMKNLEDQLLNLQKTVVDLKREQDSTKQDVAMLMSNDSYLIELVNSEVKQHFAKMMGEQAKDKDESATNKWITSTFATKEEMQQRVQELTGKLHKAILEQHQASAAAAAAANLPPYGGCRSCSGEVGEEEVRMMIRQALAVYDADKTGRVDYALETAGGSVINVRCTETYSKRTAQLSLFGIPLWYASNSPRTAIQPTVHPGQCWAFKGSEGHLVVQLAGTIYITGFTMEHIPRSLSPSGQIRSAPRDFSVIGLADEFDTKGTLIGNFTYDGTHGDAVQYFPVFKNDLPSFHLVELYVLNNWGNEDYTCLYRFRVHGNLMYWNTET